MRWTFSIRSSRSTARELGVENPFDVGENLRAGALYLRRLLDRFDGDTRLALAGYNAGERAVERYLGIPPYPETQNYVRKVLRAYGRDHHPPIERPLVGHEHPRHAAAAEFSLDLVDKAVLSLQPRRPNAIVEAFYGRRGLGVNTASEFCSPYGFHRFRSL